LADLVKAKLGVPVQYCNGGQSITTVSVTGGSGFWPPLLTQAQAIITGEAKHSDFLLAKQHGVSLITAGHFATEVLIVPVLITWLREAFSKTQWYIAQEQGPFYA